MPRPTSRAALLQQSQAQYEKLLAYLDALPPAQLTGDFPPGTLNRNVRDVLAHLYHWHELMRGWYAAGMAGEKPAIPAPGYRWKDTPALNRHIWETYRDHPLSEVRQRFEASHAQVQALIEAHSDAELFEKRRYPWTGTTSLGAYFISATASHYDWALKLIRKATR